jgi:fructoselysine-6-P-deglycase FrlB-like protein
MNTFLEDILDQPGALNTTLECMSGAGLAELDQAAGMIEGSERVVLTSMGSAHYSLAPMAFALSRMHPNVHLVETGELMRAPLFPHTLYVIMSRSGESKEISAFSARLHEEGEPLLAITMTPGSSLAQNASLAIHDPAPYDGFICTKAYTSLALCGLLVVSRLEGALDEALVTSLRQAFAWMDAHKEPMLAQARGIGWLGKSLTFLSRGAGLGLAQSGALWLEEAARVRASYSSIDFFLHGPVEQVDEVFLGAWIDLAPDEFSHAQAKAVLGRGGRWITVGPNAEETNRDETCAFNIPDFDLPEAYRILPAAMPVQLVACQSATRLGLTPGEMRYLSWVVK